MKFTCAFLIFLSYSPIAKRTHIRLAFAHTYVLFSPEFDDIDNSPIAKRTHFLSAFAHTYVLLSPDFDDMDNAWLCILNVSLLHSNT